MYRDLTVVCAVLVLLQVGLPAHAAEDAARLQVGALAAQLAEQDEDRRAEAARALAALGPAAADAVPALTAALDDDDSQVQLEAVRALGAIGPPARRASLQLLVLRAASLDSRVKRALRLGRRTSTAGKPEGVRQGAPRAS